MSSLLQRGFVFLWFVWVQVHTRPTQYIWLVCLLSVLLLFFFFASDNLFVEETNLSIRISLTVDFAAWCVWCPLLFMHTGVISLRDLIWFKFKFFYFFGSGGAMFCRWWCYFHQEIHTFWLSLTVVWRLLVGSGIVCLVHPFVMFVISFFT